MRLLIVEDDFFLADRLAAVLTQDSHEIVGIAATADKAIQLLASRTCDAAIVDAQLSGSCSDPVGKALRRRGIPFVVVSGYPRDQVLNSLRDAPFLPKPIDPSTLRDLISTLDRSPAVAT